MKISIDFFSKNADNIYSQGLDKTGISIDKIPKIDVINKKVKIANHLWLKIIAMVFITPTILWVIDNKEDIFQLKLWRWGDKGLFLFSIIIVY